MSAIQYRYYISLDGGEGVRVYPLRDATPAFSMKRFENEVFHREDIEGITLYFEQEDYTLIRSADIETEFVIYKYEMISGVETLRFTGVFYRTDCRFINHAQEAQVTFVVQDSYKKIIESLDKEHDLYELNVPKVSFQYTRSPIFQFVVLENLILEVQPKVTNIAGGSVYEVEMTNPPVGGGDLLINYHFGGVGGVAFVTGEEGMNPDISGSYIAGLAGFVRQSDSRYRIRVDDGTGLLTAYDDLFGGVPVYEAASLSPGDHVWDDAILVSNTTGHQAKFIWREIYGRVLCNTDTVLGQPTYDIPEVDIVDPLDGYTKCIGIGRSFIDFNRIVLDPANILYGGNQHRPEPTIFPPIPDTEDFFVGEYIDHPEDYEAGEWFQINESTWKQGSFWFIHDSVTRSIQDELVETITENNAYLLEDVLQALLTANEIPLTFASDTTSSQFFFDPSNPINGSGRNVVFAPKSNIILGQYNNPARYAPIKLNNVFSFLEGVYSCKWHTTATHLVVEHREFYHRGMSYGTNNVTVDLTSLVEPKSGTAWAFRQTEEYYDKSAMPEQIRFYWMDDVSKPFRGFPINIRSRFVQLGDIREYRIDWFTSDIEFMGLAQTEVARKGFFVAEVELVDGVYTIPVVTVTTTNGGSYKLQNGYLSLLYLVPTYHKYVLPATNVTVNVEDVSALSVKRSRLHDLELPSKVITAANVMNMITTELGDALVREVTDNVDGSGSKLVVELDID